MRATLIGDNHFQAGYNYGKIDTETGLNTRLLDYEKTLAKIIDYTINNRIELCVFLGDIFETRNPQPHAIVVFYRQLMRLSKAGVKVVIISGNHDSTKQRRTITTSLDPLKELNIPNVHIFTSIDNFIFTDRDGESLNLILMPYRNRQNYDRDTKEEALNDMKAELKQATDKMKPNTPSLLCGHMMLQGTIPDEVGENGLNELVLPFDMFEGINVVVCGHIHSPKIMKEDPLFIYSGSMECRDFSEREHNKNFLVYDSAKTGLERITHIPIHTRPFFIFDIDFTNMPAEPMEEVFERLNEKDMRDAVVKVQIKMPEKEVGQIDIHAIKAELNRRGVSHIAEVSVSPLISRHTKNQQVSEAVDDKSAFKSYIGSQKGIDADVLALGMEIIESVEAK